MERPVTRFRKGTLKSCVMWKTCKEGDKLTHIQHQSVTIYGAEVRDLSKNNRRTFLATEMDYSSQERVRNKAIRGSMDIEGEKVDLNQLD